MLILTPPGLVEQWREELTTKFGIPDFVTSNDDEFRALGVKAWTQFPLVIASLITARIAKHRQVITSEMYDLLIVDEAHHLENRASVSWKLVNELQKRFILLLTATPVQNSLNELYNLVTVLKPGQLKSRASFHANLWCVVAHAYPRTGVSCATCCTTSWCAIRAGKLRSNCRRGAPTRHRSSWPQRSVNSTMLWPH